MMTQIMLAMMVASRTSWVTSTVVMPSSLQTWRMSSCILDLVGLRGGVQKQELGRGQEDSG